MTALKDPISPLIRSCFSTGAILRQRYRNFQEVQNRIHYVDEGPTLLGCWIRANNSSEILPDHVVE